VNKYQPRGKPRGQENIPALKKAGDDAARMKESSDEDLSHIGQTIEKLADKLIAMRKEQQEKKEAHHRGSKKFYTSADASVVEDD
jgi:hypothetical protein